MLAGARVVGIEYGIVRVPGDAPWPSVVSATVGPGVTCAAAPDTQQMGRGQVVRRGTLDPVFEGSNPSAPANFSR